MGELFNMDASVSTVSSMDTDLYTNLWLDGTDSIHLTPSSQPLKLLFEVTHIRLIIFMIFGC